MNLSVFYNVLTHLLNKRCTVTVWNNLSHNIAALFEHTKNNSFVLKRFLLSSFTADISLIDFDNFTIPKKSLANISI